MKRLLNLIKYFSLTERILWLCSVIIIISSFFIFGAQGVLSLIASLIGVTALIFCAKGNPVGQVLVIIFSLIYGYISFSFSYYGEMLTYTCMTMPMAVFALISWLRNPYNNNKSEVKVNHIKWREYVLLTFITVLVTVAFYFILDLFNTQNLIPSTVSVTTSFVAVYLTARRSPFYAIGYALNDVVLIVLWVLASIDDISYISMVACFVAFLANDIYGFISWRRMEKRQQA